MPTFSQIYGAYKEANRPQLTLNEFAKLGNLYTGDQSFADVADDGTIGSAVKKASYWIDRGLESTGAPQRAGEAGGALFKALGLPAEKGQEVGAAIPRGVTNFLPLLIPGVGEAYALAGAGALSAANAYEQTDSLGSAATAAAMPAVGLRAGRLAASALGDALGMTKDALAQKFLGRLGLYAAENVGAITATESLHAATSGQVPTLDKEYFASMALQQIPFAVGALKTLLTKPHVVVNKDPDLTAPKAPAPVVQPEPVVVESPAEVLPAKQPAEPTPAAIVEHVKAVEDRQAAKLAQALETTPDQAELAAKTELINAKAAQELLQPPAEKQVIEPVETVVDLTPPSVPAISEFAIQPEVIKTIDRLRFARGQEPLDVAVANQEVQALIEANPEKSVNEILMDWSNKQYNQLRPELERNVNTIAGSLRGPSVNEANDRGAKLIQQRIESLGVELDRLRASTDPHEQAVYTALANLGSREVVETQFDAAGEPVLDAKGNPKSVISTKAGQFNWVSEPELLLSSSGKGRQLGTPQKRAGFYILSEALEARKTGRIWRTKDVASMSPEDFAQAVYAATKYAVNQFQGIKTASGEKLTEVPLSELTTSKPSDADEVTISDVVSDELAVAAEMSHVDNLSEAPAADLETSFVQNAIDRAVYDLASEPTPKVAWLTKIKSKYAPHLDAMAKELGVPTNQLRDKLLEKVKEVDFIRGADGIMYERADGTETVIGSPTFDGIVREFLLRRGESADLIETLLPKYRQLAHMWNMDDVQFGKIINDDASMKAYGFATVTGPVRKVWLDLKNTGNLATDQASMIATTAHEAGHLVDQLYNENKLAPSDRAKYEAVLKWKETATPEELQQTLAVAIESMLPKAWHKLDSVKNLLRHADKTEILASLHGVWSLGKVTGSDASLFGALLPAQPRGWFETMTKIARRLVGGLKSVFYIDGNKRAHTALKELNSTWLSMESGLRQAANDLSKARAFFDHDMDNINVLRTSSLQVWQNPETVSVGKFAALMAPEQESLLPNAPAGLLKTMSRVASYFIESLPRLVEAHPKLKEIGTAVLDTPGTAHNYNRLMLKDLYGDINPVTGKAKTLPKAQRQMLETVHGDQVANRFVNDVLLAEAKSGKLFDPAKAEPEFKALIDSWKYLPEVKRNHVADYIARVRQSNKITQQLIVDTFSHSGDMSVAKLIAMRSPALHDGAIQISRELSTALRLEAAQMVPEATLAMQNVQKQLGDAGLFADAAKAAREFFTRSQELEGFFKSRPSFQSYMRLGDYVVHGFKPDGTQVYHALPARNANEAARLEKLLRSQGLRVEIKNTSRGSRFGLSDDVQTALEVIDDKIKRKMLAEFGNTLSPEQVDKFVSEFSIAGQLQHAADVYSKFTPAEEGRSLAGAEWIDAVEQRRQGAKLIANSLAKQRAGATINFWKGHPKLRSPDMQMHVDRVSEAWDNYQVQDSKIAAAMAQFAGVYYLALNLPNMLAELIQPFTTVLAQATAQHGAFAATKSLGGVLKDLAGYYSKKFLGIQRSSDEFSKWFDPEERNMLENMHDRGYFARSLYTEGVDGVADSTLDHRLREASGAKAKLGSLWPTLSTNAMRLYELSTRHNTRVASILGYRLARKAGATHEAAITEAERFVETGAYNSSRATRPVGLFGKNTRAIGQLAHVLQGYNFSFLSQAARHIQRGWLMDNQQLKSYGFTAADKSRAKQASLMLLGTQFAAAGALGLPFAGAMAALFEKLTKQDLKSEAYQWLADQFGEDQEEGAFAADSVMRGFANAVFEKAGMPVDIGSRFAVGGLPGMSEYAGFDANAIGGPVGGLVKNAVTAVGQAANGNFGQAVKSILPPAIKKLFDLAQFGDATDKNGNLLGLTAEEKTLYALGFQPSRVRRLRDFESMLDTSMMARRSKQDKVEAEILAALDVADPATLNRLLMEKADELGVEVRQLAADVATKKVQQTMPKDFRSVASKYDAKEANALARALGVDFGTSREYEKTQARSSVYSRLGMQMPRYSAATLRARMEDRLAEIDPLASFAGLPQY